MASGAAYIKRKLDGVIERMASSPARFALAPDVDFTRKRKIPFTSLMRMLLSFGGNSLNKELYDFCQNLDVQIPTASAFVQQRAKLDPAALEHLFHEFNNICEDAATYRGYRILAVDGTTMTYHGLPSDDTYMPPHGNWNQFHVNALFDLLNKVYVDAIVKPRLQENEARGAWQMAERSLMGVKRIIIADRNYGSINMIEHFNRAPGLEYVIRLQNERWKELRDIPMTNIDTQISITLCTSQTNETRKACAEGRMKWIAGPGKYKKRKTAQWDFESPFTMRLRIVRFEIAPDSYETIVTSLPASQFPLSEIRKLYSMRWGIETSFRELKYAIGVTNFHAKKRNFILQEIFARLTMYNFCQRIIKSVIIAQGRDKKWVWQVNYTMGIHICRRYYQARSLDPPDIEKDIGNYILPVRPGRSDKRKVTPKGAVYFMYRVA